MVLQNEQEVSVNPKVKCLKLSFTLEKGELEFLPCMTCLRRIGPVKELGPTEVDIVCFHTSDHNKFSQEPPYCRHYEERR